MTEKELREKAWKENVEKSKKEAQKRKYENYDEVEIKTVYVSPNRRYVLSAKNNTDNGDFLLNIAGQVQYTTSRGKLIENPTKWYNTREFIACQISTNCCPEALVNGLVEFFNELKESRMYKRKRLDRTSFEKSIAMRNSKERKRQEKKSFSMFE